MVLEWRGEDAERGVGAMLADHEVRGQVTGGPALAQRGGIGADGEEQVAERVTFGSGEVGRHRYCW